MARVFTDGAEFQDTLFWSVAGSAFIDTSVKRSGTASYKYTGGTPSQESITAVAEGYWRVGFYHNGLVTTQQFLWLSGSTTLGYVQINGSTGRIEIYTSTGTLRATGTFVTDINTWYLLEIHIVIHDTTGIIEVRVDGIDDVTWSGDTKPGTDAAFDTLEVVATAANRLIVDDLAFNDTTGAVDNSWCGDGKIVMLPPSSDGDTVQWTPSVGSNWQNVDEFPPTSDTDYNYASTSGYVDLYNTTTFTIPGDHVVTRVYAEARTREETAAGDVLQYGLKTNGTQYWSSGSLQQTTSYARYVGTEYLVNPNTSIAWSQGDLDALQVGVKIP